MRIRAALFVASLLCLAFAIPATAGAATASWQFEPASFDFGTRFPGEGPTLAEAFELRNTGETSLSPELVTVSSVGAAGFKLASNSCNHALAPGAGCTVEVTFAPRTEGRKEGTLTVETSSPGVAPATAQLTGSGGEPIVIIDPPVVNFDTVTIPTNGLLGKSSERTITVSNAGTANLSIKGLGFAEETAPLPDRSDFGSPGNLIGPDWCYEATVPPGGSCTIPEEFHPQSPGTYKARLEIIQEPPAVPLIIPLNGTAVAQAVPPPPPPAPPQLGSLPKFGRKPAARTKGRVATFVFSAESSPGGFMCRWTKRGPFHFCTSPFHLHELKPGPHVFSVYAVGNNGTAGPARTYRWRVLRP